jgi:hypothetical protein
MNKSSESWPWRRRALRASVVLLTAMVLSGCGGPVQEPAPDEGAAEEVPEATDYVPTAAGAPSTDVWIATLTGTDGGLTVREPVNVTDRDGYDNQPAFLLDGSAVLFTSGRSELQTDIYRYDLASGEITQVTDTPSSEFSPTPLPGGGFSTIHEAAGEQLLWRFDLDGTDRGEILPEVQPVGYQAWNDAERVAMFVLGDPATLQLANLATGEVRVVASDIGRSLHKVPGEAAISFVDKSAGDVWYVRKLDLGGGGTTELVATLAGREDMAWTPDGTILMGDGAELYAWRPGGNWYRIADLSSAGVQGITRLAVSPAGDRIAIVADRPVPGSESGR